MPHGKEISVATPFRHEHKYVAPETVLSVLEERARVMMPIDMHAGTKNRYQIRSLYLDDVDNSCYWENEDGTDPREKFRIRIYNCSPDRIMLELKQKRHGMCHKVSEPMDLARCQTIMEGNIPAIRQSDGLLMRAFIMRMRSRGLRPVVIVTYERDPFVWREGNVRITFDRNIRSSMDFTHFFDSRLASRPVLGLGTNMLEVKYDELLPDFLNAMLQTALLRVTSFSKYYLCRRFAMNGIRPE